jgi:cyclic beta-1,2-glucan synthetase
LEGIAIPEGAEDAYFAPTVSTEAASFYEHCARTIDRSLAVGVHGLPLMGSGDWNDGMNQVGVAGRGESVWLGWFACSVVAGFAPLARNRGETKRATDWETAAREWKAALTTQGWDGAWFKRAYFDNGDAMGSAHNAECQIDLIAQAWSVIFNNDTLETTSASRSQQAKALDSMHSLLFKPEDGLLQLLTPPFEKSDPSPGYIQAYPPGVRENGGQYTHAGVWALMAQAQAQRQGIPVITPWSGDPQPDTGVNLSAIKSRGDLAYSYFGCLSSAHRANHSEWGRAYGLEPYVLAGDVYSHAPYKGKGGWSWYTGAAGWLHQAAISAMFGLDMQAKTLSFSPCLPAHWDEAKLTLTRAGVQMHFRITRTAESFSPPDLQPGERLLGVDEELPWQTLQDNSHYVIFLPELPATAIAANQL